jgi:predicted ATPase
MAQQPFLKSIRPVNLLSFGPNTEEIELRPLNILIGPNGSGKSNLIEILGLLSKLPDKDPWSDVIETGGVDEWIWKGAQKQNTTNGQRYSPLIGAQASRYAASGVDMASASPLLVMIQASQQAEEIKQQGTNGTLSSIQIAFQAESPDDIRNYKIELIKHPATYSFHVHSENVWVDMPQDHRRFSYLNRPFNSPDSVYVYEGVSPNSKIENLDVRLSVLKQIFGPSYQRALSDLPHRLSKISLYRDWVFGRHAAIRDPQHVGLDSYEIAGDSSNLAQVLKAMRDRGEQTVLEHLIELLRTFYAPVKDVDSELVGDRLRIMIKEEGLSSRTPASRLSDGTLRWLTLLIILLDPTPPPVICIDEPELGLHPDIIPTLADLLRDASTRTQLILTTHSTALVDAFSDEPEAVCVCEKVNGATEIRRLEADRLKVWMEKYSLGQLWSSGEIGGNRW